MSKYESHDCYKCGEEVLIDSNNNNPDGDECYKGDDRLGVSIFYCSICL